VSRLDEELVHDALDHIEMLKRHLDRGDIADETVADAVSLRLAAAIEAISETTFEFRERTFGNDWKIIWATRNRIAHGYAYVDLGIIRATVEQDLPDFEQKLRQSIE
jgi:uncharacterized protein with HEPN domain